MNIAAAISKLIARVSGKMSQSHLGAVSKLDCNFVHEMVMSRN